MATVARWSSSRAARIRRSRTECCSSRRAATRRRRDLPLADPEIEPMPLRRIGTRRRCTTPAPMPAVGVTLCASERTNQRKQRERTHRDATARTRVASMNSRVDRCRHVDPQSTSQREPASLRGSHSGPHCDHDVPDPLIPSSPHPLYLMSADRFVHCPARELRIVRLLLRDRQVHVGAVVRPLLVRIAILIRPRRPDASPARGRTDTSAAADRRRDGRSGRASAHARGTAGRRAPPATPERRPP